MLLTGHKTAGQLVLSYRTRVLLLEGRHHIDAMSELHVETNLRLIQQYIQISLIFRKDMFTIGKAVGIKLRKLENKV